MGSINADEFIEAIDEDECAHLATGMRNVAEGRVVNVIHAAMMVAADCIVDTFIAGSQPKDIVIFSLEVWKNTMEASILARGGISPDDKDALERAMQVFGYKKR